MATTRKHDRDKSAIAPVEEIEPRSVGSTSASRRRSAVSISPLEVALETQVLLSNLAQVDSLLARSGSGRMILHRVQAVTFARLASLHDIGGSSPAAESCREVGRRFSGTSRADARDTELALGDRVPIKSEVEACGPIKKKIKLGDPEYTNLVSNTNAEIVFKDEEGTGADRMMSALMKQRLDRLATAVAAEWAGARLRVTEAWDQDNEHAGNSLHYEGRAADLTTYPVDSAKLGRLGRLAVEAGFDWVWYENAAHIHVSVIA